METGSIDQAATATQGETVIAALLGKVLPTGVPLPSTTGPAVDLASFPGRVVVFVHPMICPPDTPSPAGWDVVPGAKGCTAQSCAYRDTFAAFAALGVTHLFGLSVKPLSAQTEAADRLRLPYPLLSDAERRWSNALGIPELCVGDLVVLRRLTLIVRGGRIEHVFYPVTAPHQNASDVIAWLCNHPL